MSILMPAQTLSATLEFVINKALTLNIHSNSQLDKLAGMTLTVNLRELAFPLSFTVSDRQVMVTGIKERSDCEINTDIKTLLRLKKEQALTRLIKEDLLDIQGDLKVAQGFAAVADNLEIDWQSELARYIGDIATHKLVQTGQALKEKFAFAARQIQSDAGEYLVHEQKLAVTGSQLTYFNEQVSTLTAKTQALMARVQSMDEQLKSSPANDTNK
ncbi:ubiquinone biosynthesis accessory factor UbiJ [Thalassomonas actiniarum]|uniref:Ubiquinone biosynthesis accessory factor UbiJ n=1 Tax=Thalassomonas actiniarum TaxID=485447 RepID=A0AAE9YQ27_9GAMM|nr:SCP2 sterol-binding domain-containing protein [Thalassomonas actiniarum]WDD98970.1 SCP2 sterol-binding domain-containing protein [Thalassomonas actiniarum]